jgi:hypothetical protein
VLLEKEGVDAILCHRYSSAMLELEALNGKYASGELAWSNSKIFPCDAGEIGGI